MIEELKAKYPDTYEIVEMIDGSITVCDENGLPIETYCSLPYQENVKVNKKYEYDYDRQSYYDPDNYGGFPSHW